MFLIRWLFWCRHKDFSFPLTPRKGERHSEASMVTGTYVVCLECGEEFPYDWKLMRITE